MNQTLIGSLLVAMMVGLVYPTTEARADQYDRRVVVINDTSMTLVEFYASNVGTEEWQEDILGEDVLDSGETATINIDDDTGYCRYDFLAIFEDGTEVVNPDVNVCEAESISYE